MISGLPTDYRWRRSSLSCIDAHIFAISYLYLSPRYRDAINCISFRVITHYDGAFVNTSDPAVVHETSNEQVQLMRVFIAH